MKVLVIGSGAREHAIAWLFSKSDNISGIYAAPGNAGTDEIGTNIEQADPINFDSVTDICKEHEIDFVFVGPETPLSSGIVDRLNQEGIAAIGPKKKSAMLESSKTFSKRFSNDESNYFYMACVFHADTPFFGISLPVQDW